jgi:carbamate kinase
MAASPHPVPRSGAQPAQSAAPGTSVSAASTAPDAPAARGAARIRRIVVAFGGNASYPPTIKGLASEQLALIAEACGHLVRIIQSGYQLVLTHGNGPVVGNILFRMAKTANELPPMPMDICVAHSQGGMGYMLQQTLCNVLHEQGVTMSASSIITQVEVSADDPGFAKPSKPVGRFFSHDDADRLAREQDWQFVEDAGRGYRRVVPSPQPLRILDLPAVEALLAANVIPIAIGGGGIPVVRDGKGNYHGVSAVIDKDLTSAMLAAELGAEALVMLTGVERVALDYGKPSQRSLDCLTVAEAQRYMADGQFPPGSMGPKIAAALRYLNSGGGQVIITSLARAYDALQGNAGTRIVR